MGKCPIKAASFSSSNQNITITSRFVSAENRQRAVCRACAFCSSKRPGAAESTAEAGRQMPEPARVLVP